MLARDLIMLHENVCPHTAYALQDTLRSMHRKMLDHSQYNLDLSLCDFHVFGSFKR
jgi:hypothetical protein